MHVRCANAESSEAFHGDLRFRSIYKIVLGKLSLQALSLQASHMSANILDQKSEQAAPQESTAQKVFFWMITP